MKKAGFSCIALFILLIFFFPPPSFADIQTGNVTSETKVYNSVSGGGTTYTHIETTVNGKTNVIDSSDQGEIDVKNDNGNVTVTKIPNPTITPVKIATITPIIKPVPHKTSVVSGFWQNFKNFLKRIFRDL